MKKKNLILYGMVFIIVFMLFGVCGCYVFTPKIEIYNTNSNIEVGDEYVEPKYYVSLFNKKIDKDCVIRSNVNKDVIGSYYVEYEVNNFIFSNKKRIRVNVVDNVSPVIELKGEKIIYVYVGDEYKEYGYSASDNYDGDISGEVKVTNNVDVNKVGNYEVNYSVVDTSSNVFSVSREIRVIEHGTSRNGVIYLTFDDGPSATITEKVLNILKEEGVSATFFVIHHDSSLHKLIKREYDEGHTVAIHSYTHDYGTIYSGVDNFYNDLDKIKSEVKGITGEDSKLFRFPGGGSNTVSRRYFKGIMSILTEDMINRGYHYFDWNISSGDAGEVSSSIEVYNNVVRQLSKEQANVILMHDFENNYYTLNALRDIIRYGKDNGYTFDKITMSTEMVRHSVAN